VWQYTYSSKSCRITTHVYMGSPLPCSVSCPPGSRKPRARSLWWRRQQHFGASAPSPCGQAGSIPCFLRIFQKKNRTWKIASSLTPVHHFYGTSSFKRFSFVAFGSFSFQTINWITLYQDIHNVPYLVWLTNMSRRMLDFCIASSFTSG